jgi:hypothetical protein
MYRIGLLALMVSGCSKPDCEAFGNKVASREKNVNAATDVAIAAFEACKKGEAPASYVKCVLAAKTRADEDKCGDDGEAKTAEKPKHIVQGPGFVFEQPDGWKHKDGAAGMTMLDNDEQHVHVMFLTVPTANKDQWNDDAACKAEAQQFASKANATIESSELATTKLGKACRYVLTFGDQRGVTTTWPMGPDNIVMTCSFDAKLPKPPASCDEIAASIKFGDNR